MLSNRVVKQNHLTQWSQQNVMCIYFTVCIHQSVAGRVKKNALSRNLNHENIFILSRLPMFCPFAQLTSKNARKQLLPYIFPQFETDGVRLLSAKS